MNQTTVLVTGAAGKVGTELVKVLMSSGEHVRAADRNASKIINLFGGGVEAVDFDFKRPETYQNAVRHASSLFLLRPPQISNVEKYLFPVVDAACKAGIRRVVFLSIIGVEQNMRVPHYHVEQYLKSLQVPYTILRASFFMQNLNTTHLVEIRDRNEIFIPAGNANTSFIDVRDIAAVAAQALTSPGNGHQVYELTGAEALDYYTVAGLFSEILGRKITYQNPSTLKYVLANLMRGQPLLFLLVTAWLYRNTQQGMAAKISPDVERILGRPPISLRRYIQDYRSAWMPSA